jgi:hypothetical protein
MNRLRIRFGILQCVLALLLMLDAPNPDFDLRGPASVAAASASDLAVLSAQPPEAVYKSETGNGAGIFKRKDDHGPQPGASASAGTIEPPRLELARSAAPPALHVRRHRVLASPPTGPPSA